MNPKNKNLQYLSAVGISALLAPFALAQEANPEQQVVLPAGGGQEIEELVVTGSRIVGASETGLVPVSVLDQETLESFGAESTGDLLANLAQAGSFEFNESSDGPNNARGDIATVNLRGLGSGNTLVLLNGRRYVTHPFTTDIDSTPRAIVNVNSIPSSAIGRTEILKDGASGIYGADAAAGVVNLILDDDFEGARLSFRVTEADGIDYGSSKISFSGGTWFNDNRTHLSVFASSFKKDGIFAADRVYSESVDKRDLLPTSWAGDTQFRNTSSLSPWGQFQVGAQVGEGLFEGFDVGSETGSNGGFHIQPADDDTSPSGVLTTGVNIDDDAIPSSLDTDLRYDFNIDRQLSPKVTRNNIFSTLSHDFDNGMRFFGELSFYDSNTDSQRATQPIDEGLAYLVIPASNYWNPFGPVAFADSSPNPNRIVDTSVLPVEGSDVLIAKWRPTDIGPRIIDTEASTYRILGGIEGTFGDWDWESALFYSYADAVDTASNRISKTLLVEQLARSDAGAINPFGGPGANTSAQFDAVRISTTNEANSSITSWDFQVTRGDLFNTPWADSSAGIAMGVDWRNEDYEDDRDPRLDGTISFQNGVGSNLSDVAGVSPTPDSSGQRNVYSAYSELLIPLVSNKPGVERLDFQIAGRFESFDDIEENIFKPKYALSWAPVDQLTFRTGYSEGFRAPNLVQLYRGDVSRLNLDLDDFWRDQAGLPDASGDIYRRNIRISNPELDAEDTQTTFIGFQFDTYLLDEQARVLLTMDLWKFEQENVISTFGAKEQLALDYLLRQQGSFNPLVVREAPTAEDIVAFVGAGMSAESAAGRVRYVRDPYINLDPRSVKGVDLALRVDLPDTELGRFNFQIEASKLLEFEQENIALQPLLNNDGILNSDTDLGEELRGLTEDKVKLDGNPELRMSGSLNWRKKNWGAAWSFNYIDEFYDTSAVNDASGDFWTVDSWFVMNAHVDYRFNISRLSGARVRLGVTNLKNEEPPLADESRGYFTSFHNNRGRSYSLSLRVDL